MVASEGAAARPRRRKRVLELVCPYGAGKQRGRHNQAVCTHTLSEELGAVALCRKAPAMLAVRAVRSGPDRIDGSLGRDQDAAAEGQAGRAAAYSHRFPRPPRIWRGAAVDVDTGLRGACLAR